MSGDVVCDQILVFDIDDSGSPRSLLSSRSTHCAWRHDSVHRDSRNRREALHTFRAECDGLGQNLIGAIPEMDGMTGTEDGGVRSASQMKRLKDSLCGRCVYFGD